MTTSKHLFSSLSLMTIASLAALLYPIGRAAAADPIAAFDGAYAGHATVTSARTVDCGAKGFTSTLSIADGIVSLVYTTGGEGKSIVLRGVVTKNGMFSGEGTGEFLINMAGSVARGHVIAKTWAWNCEYALNLEKGVAPTGALASRQD
jgi:hypothetical protein